MLRMSRRFVPVCIALLAALAMHGRELRADSPTVVFDLLAFDPNGALGLLTETGKSKGQFGGLDGHAELKNPPFRAAGERRCGIKGGAPGAGPKAKADIPEDRWNRAVQL